MQEYRFKRAWPTTNRGGVDAGVVRRAQRVFEGLQVLVERLEQGRGGGLSQPNGIGHKGVQPAPSISLARRVHFGAPLPDPVSNEWGNGYQDICLYLHSHRPMYIYLEAPAIQTQDRFGGLAFVVQGFQNDDRLWGGVVIAVGSEKMKHL